MTSDERDPSRHQQLRHLLPRWPPDWVVALLIAAGLIALFVAGPNDDDSRWFLLPGALAAVVQKVGGHIAAWRSDGVERAYVLESAAMSFYLLVLLLLVVTVLQAVGVLDAPDAGWALVAALFLDTAVRDWAKNRYV